MKTLRLDAEEQELLESYEAGEWVASGSPEALRPMARATLAKTKRVNLRLSDMDLISLQRKAAREGIPPQTLMGSILHKYATGLLREAV
jgi:predicted DNA binding CopG/RHH family protein